MTTAMPGLNPDPPAQLQSKKSFEELVLPHLPSLRRFVSSRVRNWHDAEDIVQQTLVLAFRHIGQFRFESSLATWLYRIAVNVIRGRLRSAEMKRTIVADTEEMESLGLRDQRPSALAMLERKETSEQVRGAIARLPEMYRIVVESRDLNGLTIRETADSLFLTTPAVKSRHLRGRSLLSDLMREPNGSLIPLETPGS